MRRETLEVPEKPSKNGVPGLLTEPCGLVDTWHSGQKLCVITQDTALRFLHPRKLHDACATHMCIQSIENLGPHGRKRWFRQDKTFAATAGRESTYVLSPQHQQAKSLFVTCTFMEPSMEPAARKAWVVRNLYRQYSARRDVYLSQHVDACGTLATPHSRRHE